jgi:hypothetical protein
MSAAEPEAPAAPTAPETPEAAPQKRASVFTPKLVVSLIALWAGASGILYWISHTDWWLCALGGLGAVLVIWPGPKQP